MGFSKKIFKIFKIFKIKFVPAGSRPVHLLLHCDPRNAAGPEIRQWRSRAEEAAGKVDPALKIFDLRLRKNEDKRILEFQLLIPRGEVIDEAEIRRKFAEKLSVYPDLPELNILFTRSYV